MVQMLRAIQDRQDVLMLENLGLPASKQLSRLEHVLNLPAVHIHVGELLELAFRNGILLDAAIKEVLPDHASAVDG